MGKKNKTVNTALWALKNPGKAKEMEDRFGVNVRQGAGWKSDGGETYEEYQESSDWHNKMTDAARNDYDLRRTLEAAAMSGKSKADKILDKGFNNLDDVAHAMNFSEKAAKRHGQGGDFSSNSDYMGLTQSMVERDRRKQTEGYNKDFALGADLAALRTEMDERFDEKSENVLPAQLSETTSAAESTKDEYELNLGGTGTEIFGGGSPQEQEQAQEFADNAKDQVKKGLQLSNVEARGPRSGVRPGAGF